MASITLAQAALQSQDPLVAGIVSELYTSDAFFAAVPAFQIVGRNYSFTREATEHGATWTNVGVTINKTQATVTAVNHPLGRAIGDVEIDTFERISMSNVNDLAALHSARLLRRLGRKARAAAISGTGTFPEPKGLANHVTSAQTLTQANFSAYTTTGVDITFAVLDTLLDKVDASGDQPFLMTNKAGARDIKAAIRTAGTGDVDAVELGYLNPLTGQRGIQRVLSYSGVPVFVNENVGTYTTNSNAGRTYIYAGVLGGDGVSLILPANLGDMLTTYGGFLDPNKPQWILRSELIFGVTCRSTKALARLDNVVLDG